MAQHLMRRQIGKGGQGLILLACCVLTSLAAADSLRDPTRPPASFDSRADRGNINRDSSNSGPVLQSVLISPNRKVAIINGETVALGQKFEEAVVVKITESEVVLRNGSNLQTLKLFPGVEKRPALERATAKRDGRG